MLKHPFRKRCKPYLLLAAFFILPLIVLCQVVTDSATIKVRADSNFLKKEDTLLRIIHSNSCHFDNIN